MTKYEIMYIIHPTLDDAQRAETINKFNGVLTDNGAVITETKVWGLKDLAYEINKVNKGYYMILKVDAPNAAISEFERIALIDKNVIRHIIIREEA